MSGGWSLDVAMAPDAAARRIAGAINLPKKRLFGVLKVQREFLGVVDGTEFEIWERQARAVHALGRVRGVRGGSRIEARFAMPARTRALIVVFFVLFLLAAAAIADSRPQGFGSDSIVVLAAGFAALAGLFATGAWWQRRDLRTFIVSLFPREPGT